MERKKASLPIVIWEAIYPVLLYYAIVLVVTQLFLYIVLQFDPADATGLVANYPLRQLISVIVTLPFMFSIYANDRNANQGMMLYMKEHKPSVDFEKIGISLLCMVAVTCISFGLGNLLSMTPLIELSKGYQEASEHLYAGSVSVELLNSALMVPIIEELVFRGIVLYRMQIRMNRWLALLVSSLLFAIMHLNIVQFIFALLIGLVLGMLVMKSGHIYPAILAHMAANAFGVLRSEFGWMKGLSDRSVMAWTGSALILVAGLFIVFCYIRKIFQRA